MYGSCAEHSHPAAFPFLYLKPLGLYYHAKALHEENAAEDRQHQLFVDNDGTHADDASDGKRATNGQTSGIAHEDLCRIGVVPKETYHCSHESAYKHHKFLCAWNIHYIQIRGVFYVAGHVGKYA